MLELGSGKKMYAARTARRAIGASHEYSPYHATRAGYRYLTPVELDAWFDRINLIRNRVVRIPK